MSDTREFKGLAKNPEYKKDLEAFAENPQVLIEISSRCNFVCSYCVSHMNLRKKTTMDVALFSRIAEQLPSVTTRSVGLHVDGEPLLHPQFAQLAKMVNDNGLSITLATNGSLLKPVAELLSIRMTASVSISTSAEEFKVRHPKLNFVDYVKTVTDYLHAWAESESEQNISLQVSYYKWKNDADFGQYDAEKIKFLAALVQQCDFANFVDGELTFTNNQAIFRKRKGSGALRIFKQVISKGGLYPVDGKLIEGKNLEFGFCDSAWKRFTILADGTPGYCCIDLAGQTTFGDSTSVQETPLAELWRHHPGIQGIREGWLQGKLPCESCKRCLGGYGGELYIAPPEFPPRFANAG